jgi:pyridoxal phosphate enzyme (YggS family)
VHSQELLQAIDDRAASAGQTQEVLVQLNLAQEASKSGIGPEQLEPLLDGFASHRHCRCVGLMTMPPFFDDPDRARPLFRQLRQLRDQLSAARRAGVDLRHLSMGMSGDFEVAIEEGATLVRVGTAIFGERH